MSLGPIAAAALGGYALGSVSFALLLARARGVDLRKVGSGNLGATNAGRALGRKAGAVVYLLDALKGFSPAVVAAAWSGDPALGAIAGTGAFFGHLWPVWHGFRGGKGVATLSGALFALAPLAVVAAGISFLAGFLLTRIASVGSLAFGLALGPAAWVLRAPQSVTIFAAGGGLALILTHRANIQRLLRGEEQPVGGRKTGEGQP
jgi:glycerol-3-phosphate acyltransferase PlsY